jgi:CheY-like chemotaxis protein
MGLPADLKILLVDDNPLNQRVAVLTFSQLKLKCDVASNGMEAFEKFRQTPYEIIFMDLQMPVLDGIESAKLIRKFEQESDREGRVVIIALSGNEYADNRNLCIEVGMDDFMEKPIRIETLQAYISKFISR